MKYICFVQDKGFLMVGQDAASTPIYTLDIYAATEATERDWHDYCMDIGQKVGYTLLEVDTMKVFI